MKQRKDEDAEKTSKDQCTEMVKRSEIDRETRYNSNRYRCIIREIDQTRETYTLQTGRGSNKNPPAEMIQKVTSK